MDLYDQVMTYFAIRDLVHLRLISSVFRESSKSYNQSIVTYIPAHARWKQTFPKAHYLLRNSPAKEEHFNYFIRLEKLTLNHYTLMKEDAFRQLPHLKYLEVWSSHWRIQHVQYMTPPMFRYLSQLHTLKLFSSDDVTDEALSYLPQLKRLVLDHCSNITSAGIRPLKQLVDLNLHTQERITDDAFEGLALVELYIHQNALITDQGIRSLTRLAKLTACKTPHIRGVGYKALPTLTTLYLNGVSVSEYSDFKHIRSFTLNHCMLPGEDYEQWSSLHSLHIYNSYMAYPASLFKVNLAPNLGHMILEHCPSMVTYEPMLRKYMGRKLMCRNLQYLHPLY